MLFSLLLFLKQVACRDVFTCEDTFCYSSWIGDGYCDLNCMNPACNFDSGIYGGTYKENFYSSDCYSDCDCDYDKLGNGECDSACNKYQCGWDLGDCGYCSDGCTEAMLTNSECDTECSSIQCMYDNNGCGWCNEGCFIADILGDECKSQCTSSYCYEYSDNPCLSSGCSYGCYESILGDGNCDSYCNNEDCGYDDGDCFCSAGCSYDDLSVSTCETDADGNIIDDCAVSDCYFKYYACGYCAKGCYYQDLGDGTCQSECNVEECNYDYGDCGCAPGCSFIYDSSTETFSGDSGNECVTACLVYSCHFAEPFCTDTDLVKKAALNYVVYQNNSKTLDTSDCTCTNEQDYLDATSTCSDGVECSSKECFYCMGSTDELSSLSDCARATFESCLICTTSMILGYCESALKECPIGYSNVDGLATLFGASYWCLPEPIFYSPVRYKEVYVDSSLDTDGDGTAATPYYSLYEALINVYASFTKIYIKSDENDLVVDATTSILVKDKYSPLKTSSTVTFYELWIIGDSDTQDLVNVNFISKMFITPIAEKVYIQNIKFIGTKFIQVECEKEFCAYCPYYTQYSTYYYDDRDQFIDSDDFKSYSTNCSSYSSYNIFVFTTNVTISNVVFTDFRSQYNSFIKSSGILTLLNVTFKRMQAKSSGSIISLSCSSDCINSNFSYYSGTVTELGFGYDDSQYVGTGSFLKASDIGFIIISEVDFTYNFLLNNMQSSSQGYLFYSFNQIGTFEISDCTLNSNYMNYLIYIDASTLEYSDIRSVDGVSMAYGQQHFLMHNLEINKLYCSRGLLYYGMQKVLQNIKLSNISTDNSVFGEQGMFYINNLGTLTNVEKKGDTQKKVVNKEKVKIYFPPRKLEIEIININNCRTGGSIIFIKTHSSIYVTDLVMESVYDGDVEDVKSIIEEFSSNSMYLQNIDEETELPDLNCSDVFSISSSYKVYLDHLDFRNSECMSDSGSPGISLDSISYIELNNSYMYWVFSSSLKGVGLDIGSSTEVFIKNLTLEEVDNYEYSVVQINNCKKVTMTDINFEKIFTNYSSPVLITKTQEFSLTDFSMKNLKTEFSNGGCLYLLTSASGSYINLDNGVLDQCVSENGKGGAIYLDGMSTKSTSKFYMNSLNLTNCEADEGAALYISSMNTFKSSFSNQFKNIIISNSISYQGAIIADYHSDGLLIISSVTMYNNTGNNAGIMSYFPNKNPSLQLEDIKIYSSVSLDSVLSFKSLEASTQVQITNMKIYDSSEDSVVIYLSKITLTASDITISNAGFGMDIYSVSVVSISRLNLNGCTNLGISVTYSSSFECYSCTFSKNSEILFSIDESSSIDIDESSIEENSASFSPLISFTSSSDVYSYISNTNIAYNYIFANSLIYLSESLLKLDNVDISYNTIDYYDYSGIYVYKATLGIENSIFSKMSSEVKGTYIYAVSSSTISINDTTFQNGTSPDSNIYITSSTVYISNCIFNYNEGADLNIETSSVEIIGSTVKNSYLGVNDNSGSFVFKNSKEIKISDSVFSNPLELSTKDYQSFVYIDTCDSLKLESSIFTGASTSVMGLYFKNSKKTSIKKSRFEHLSTLKYSALTGISTIKTSAYTVTITGSSFINNTSSDNGGGFYIDSYDLTIKDTKVLDNVASNSGGGIYYETSGCSTCGMYLTGTTTITGNQCGQDGGAIKWKDFKPEYESTVTIQNNTAKYGNDLATIPALLSFTSGRRLSDSIGNYTNIAPGQDFLGEILLYIRDTYGQIVETDSSTTLTVSLNETGDFYSVSGTTLFTAQSGVFNLTGFTPSGPPGKTVVLKLVSDFQASTARNDYTVYNNKAYLSVSFRKCIAGEQIETTACTLCPDGKYLLAAATSCKSCPTGATCSGGSSMVVKNGYWRSSIDSEVVYSCEYSAACIGGSSDDQLGSCATGYAGVMCQSCEVGYTMNSDYKCAKCPEQAANIAILIALSIGIIFVAVILVKTTLKSAFTPKAMHSIYIKIFTNYIQLVFITTQFNLEWPTYVKQLFKVQQGTATVSDQIFSVDCYLDSSNSNDRSQGYYVKICMMAAIPFFIFLISYIYWIAHSFMMDTFKYLKREVYSTIIVLFFLVYPNIVKLLFSNFNCMSIDHMDTYLKSNTDIRCWDQRHKQYSLIVVVPGIILWALGFPALLVGIMAKNKRCLHLDLYRVVFGYLFNGYKLSRFFWEFIIMYRKILLISISVFLSSQAVMIQALTVVIVLVLSLYLQYASRPYNSNELNHMETEALFTATITIYCGLYYLSNSIGEELKLVLFLVIVIGNAYFIFYWIYYMLQALVDMLIKFFPQFRGKFKKGDAFEENFCAEVLVQEGVFHNRLEDKKSYTFFNFQGSKDKEQIKYCSMNEVYSGVMKQDLSDFESGSSPD